jgi:hypothetical protein
MEVVQDLTTISQKARLLPVTPQMEASRNMPVEALKNTTLVILQIVHT